MIFECPSKTYICGEYAILAGGNALLLAHSPRFQLILNHSKNPDSSYLDSLHPQSPAGQLAKDNKNVLKDLNFSWVDPHQGRGGFGASGAQFLTLWAALKTLKKLPLNLTEMFNDFKKMDRSNSSGGDVVCQFLGGVSDVNVHAPMNSEKINWPFKEITPILVSTGVKIPTHDHLQSIKLDRFQPLTEISSQVTTAFKRADQQEFLHGIDLFQKALESLDLVVESSRIMLGSLKDISGFMGTKSCGALGADTLLVFVKAERTAQALDELKRRGFRAFRGDTGPGLEVKK